MPKLSTLAKDLDDLLLESVQNFCINQLGGYFLTVIICDLVIFGYIDLLKNVDVWMNFCGNLPNVVVWMMAEG